MSQQQPSVDEWFSIFLSYRMNTAQQPGLYDFMESHILISHESPVQQQHPSITAVASVVRAPSLFIGHESPLQQQESVQHEASPCFFSAP
jgi:hypothetical protein